ncbi:LysM peptidoglycan-binding domain-containing protein [Methylobacterium sp. W2]|uniref:LysM peptidoglycan-binding domain-containing protein n=1 Tax=Methylobacterium sp. W2 TaxID=2598107 RepID=UPI001D0BF760|nr:LysM peptidoglycan-binding domain-containing protein [Methylobacterium sp. W2]MCC0804637.1 LysM peptidoglycan-binding domain-containing protein [Methylobacterium sp. W2]
MTAQWRRGLILAGGGLLAGFALVVVFFGTSELSKRAQGDKPPVAAAALPQPKETSTPESRAAESPAAAGSPVTPPARREEGASTTPGKSSSGARGATGQTGNPPAVQDQAQAPTFDIIRVEPTGETVIAGRGTPNTTVEMLRDNHPIARALIDPSGQFAIVPPALPAGSSEITLSSIGADGQGRQARETVMVVVSADRTTKPLIALTSPDKPTVVLSQPDRPTDAASAKAVGAGPKGAGPDKSGGAARASADPAKANGAVAVRPEAASPDSSGSQKPDAVPVKVVSVDAEEGGRLFITGQAPAGATVRLYINDAQIAPGSVGADGRVSFTIGRGVAPGDYRIRIDQVDPVSGKVKNRSEVAFSMPPAAKPVVGLGQDAAPSTLAAKPSPSAALAARPHAKSSPVLASPLGRPAQGAPQDASPSTPASAMTMGRSQPSPTTDEAGAKAVSALAIQPSAAPQGVFVPEINTARITRGDSLWQISRRVYGKGTRYTVIFDANQPQIRNPDLIYPGQIFVVPSESASTLPQDKRRS